MLQLLYIACHVKSTCRNPTILRLPFLLLLMQLLIYIMLLLLQPMCRKQWLLMLPQWLHLIML